MSQCKEMNDEEKLRVIKEHVKNYPDFPQPGILFRDLFSVLANPPIFALLKEILVKRVKDIQPPVEVVIGLESRGFLFGPIISLELNIPFVPIRKKGKLPGKLQSYKYALEYGEDTIEIQEGVIKPGSRVLIVDDLLATGGTLNAAYQLVTQIGGKVAKCFVLMELTDLKGRDRIPADVLTLMNF